MREKEERRATWRRFAKRLKNSCRYRVGTTSLVVVDSLLSHLLSKMGRYIRPKDLNKVSDWPKHPQINKIAFLGFEAK